MPDPSDSARLLVLGPPRLDQGEKTARLDTRKALALLTYLSFNEQEYQRDSLTTLLWPELPQSRARAALRRTLTPLNKALGKDGLLTTRETVALNPAYPLWVDAHSFDQGLEAVAGHDHGPREVCSRCFEPLEHSLSLYRGPFMEGFTLRDAAPFDDWQFYETERLRRQLAQILERLTRGYAERGDSARAIEHARQWLALDDLHEPAHRTLMRLYARNGQRSRALRQYRDCLHVLDSELGVPPLEETTRLYEDILENRIRPVSGEDPGVGAPAERIPPAPGLDEPAPFVGRSAAWAALEGALAHTASQDRFVVIEGEMGIGKTRLANEFIGYAQQEGSRVLTAQCYEGEVNVAYAPVQTALRSAIGQPGAPDLAKALAPVWLASAGRLLPELAQAAGDLPEPDGDPIAAQNRLFEAVRQILAHFAQGSAPTVLMIDDLQWADSASIDLLSYLVRRLDDLRLMILATWRTEEVPVGHPLRALFAESVRAGTGMTIELDRLSEQEVNQLAAHFKSAPEPVRENLYANTEGLPFFVIEYLAAGFDGTQNGLPPGVQEIQKTRLAALQGAGRQLITTAAVIGRSFDYETIKTASGRSEEETVGGLEELVAARGLLVERISEDEGVARPEYDFTHETIHQVAYEQTSLARRRLLHRRVAEALMSTSNSTTENAGRIAHHLQHTGSDERAAEYHLLAGRYARSVYANTEALRNYETALALQPDGTGEIHEAIGDLLTLRGEYRNAVNAYERSAARCAPEALPHIERKLGNLHHRRGDYELAASHFQAAVDHITGDFDTEQVALIHTDWSRTAAQMGDIERSERLAQKGLRLAREKQHAIAISQAQNILGILYRKQGDLANARSSLEAALQAAGDNLHARIAAKNNLALVLADGEHHAEAIRWIREALEDCRVLGDRHREAALRNHLADRLHAVNEKEEAMENLKIAVEIFAEIGTESGDLQPEIWKLTEW